ncbi:hypothetical protein [Bacteroides uniformis]|uniref:hypothetical protein n=1 Tax=Bacteroides uniformis TaxID=820 RepID=UPI001863FD15|nr:hypothetical protein [Bacteroides uniformis]
MNAAGIGSRVTFIRGLGGETNHENSIHIEIKRYYPLLFQGVFSIDEILLSLPSTDLFQKIARIAKI